MPLSHRLHGQTRILRSTCLHGLLWSLSAIGLWGANALRFGAQSPGTPAPTVVVAEITQHTVPIYEEFVARIGAIQTVELRARVEGFLEQVLFQKGALVKAGQLLFVIEQPPYEAALQSAKAQLATAQANLDTGSRAGRSAQGQGAIGPAMGLPSKGAAGCGAPPSLGTR